MGPKARAEQVLGSKARMTWIPQNGGAYAFSRDNQMFIRAPKDPQHGSMLYVLDLPTGRLFHRQGDGNALRGRPLTGMHHQHWLRKLFADVPRAAFAARDDFRESGVGFVKPASEPDESPEKKEQSMALVNVVRKRTVIEESSLELEESAMRKLLADAGVDIPKGARFYALAVTGEEVELVLPLGIRWTSQKTTEEGE